MSVAAYVAHIAREDDIRLTICGEPFQGWQAALGADAPDPQAHPTPGVDHIVECEACHGQLD